jgi:hypothetical protein
MSSIKGVELEKPVLATATDVGMQRIRFTLRTNSGVAAAQTPPASDMGGLRRLRGMATKERTTAGTIAAAVPRD